MSEFETEAEPTRPREWKVPRRAIREYLDLAAMWRSHSAKSSPLDQALCKGFHGVQQTGHRHKIENSQLNSIDIAVIQEEDSSASVGRFWTTRALGTLRRYKLRFGSRQGLL